MLGSLILYYSILFFCEYADLSLSLLLVAGKRSNWRTRRACSTCRTSDCGRTPASRTCPSPLRRCAAGRPAAGRGSPPPPPALAAAPRSWARLRNALVPRRSPSWTPGGNETWEDAGCCEYWRAFSCFQVHADATFAPVLLFLVYWGDWML